MIAGPDHPSVRRRDHDDDPTSADRPVIAAHELTKSYGGERVLDGLSLATPRG